MPLLCASRNAGGMIVSARFRPSTSSRVQPNVASAWAFHAAILPARVDADERVVRGVDDQPRPGLALGQAGERAAPLLLGDGDDDEVGDRNRKVLLVDRPDSRAADVLGAEHADRRVVVAQRHVEHGADVIRDQVGVEELARARIGPGVVGGNDALALERREVIGSSWRCSTAPDSYWSPARDTGRRSG